MQETSRLEKSWGTGMKCSRCLGRAALASPTRHVLTLCTLNICIKSGMDAFTEQADRLSDSPECAVTEIVATACAYQQTHQAFKMQALDRMTAYLMAHKSCHPAAWPQSVGWSAGFCQCEQSARAVPSCDFCDSAHRLSLQCASTA